MPEKVTAARLCEIFGSLTHENGEPLELLERLYHPDARFQDPIQVQIGRERIIEALQHILDVSRELQFDILDAAESDRSIYITWSMYMRLRRGPAFTVDGVSHLRLEDGLIIEHRDYWDLLGEMMGMVPQVGALYRKLVAKLG